MTPERIDELEELFETMKKDDPNAKMAFVKIELIDELLAALEESQQQAEDYKSQCDHYREEAKKLNSLVKEQQKDIMNLQVESNRQLVEAQQTIARQREALEQIMDVTGVDYEDSFNKAIGVAFLALGLAPFTQIPQHPRRANRS